MPISQATVLSSNTTILTVASGQSVNVHSLIFCNVHASTTETLTVYAVLQGSSAANSNAIIKSIAIPAIRTLEVLFDAPLALDAGDKIIAIGTTGSLITATANYKAAV